MDNLISRKEFWRVESGLKWTDEANSAERGPRIEIFAEDGSEPVNFSSSPQLCVPEIKLMVTSASGGEDHLGGYLKNCPDLRVTLQFGKCYLD